MMKDIRQLGWVGCVLAFLALLQGWLLCVGFVRLANVLKIAWGRVGKVMDACICVGCSIG